MVVVVIEIKYTGELVSTLTQAFDATDFIENTWKGASFSIYKPVVE